MTLDQVTTFFAWTSVINIVTLMLAALLIAGMRNWIAGLHHWLFGIERADAVRLYFQFMAFYEVLIIVFGVVPYLVLRFLM